jgi:hypothetical protein
MAHFGAGALLGILVLHPLAMAVTWLEIRMEPSVAAVHFWNFLLSRLAATFSRHMLMMTFLYAATGGSIGLAFHALEKALEKREEAIKRLRHEIAQDIPSVISAGEGERVEFKSTARWDLHQERVNRELEMAVAKTIAGFANGAGGSLLLGVDDVGSVIGLDKDYQTLKRKDRDGFEQFLMTLVRIHLGADVCPRVHVVFATAEGRDVCRVVVQQMHRPVYLRDGDKVRYYVRTGNVTRELDVEEAVHHIEWRWGGRRNVPRRKSQS